MRIGRWQMRWSALLGCTLVGLLLLTITVGLFWMPHNPIAIDLDHTLAHPSASHWLGSDEYGRDELSRAMLGARISVFIATETTIYVVLLGTTVGLLTGFLRGWFDRIVMMVNDALLALPGILLALGLIAVLGPGRESIILTLTLAYLPSVARVVRSAVMSVREREFIDASTVAGDSTLYTMFRHVLPNILPPILILGTSVFGWVVLSESALSFLGVGVPPPAPSWGNMLSSARPYVENASGLSVVPGLCIAMTLLGVNLLGDAMRDWFDPRRDS
jgi:peptide/nickel transport system permease protein